VYQLVSMYGYGVPLASLGSSYEPVHACSRNPNQYTLVPVSTSERGGEKLGRESMKLHSDSEILTPADATRLFLDRETERLLYTNTVHHCIWGLVISGVICPRID